jgi:hypothetical protein
MSSVQILPLATRTLQYRAHLELEASVAAAEHADWRGDSEARLAWMLDYVLNAAAWQCALADERANAALGDAASPATPPTAQTPQGVAGTPTHLGGAR